MRLTVLGSSGSAPTRGEPASGYLITAADTAILVDVGPGTFQALAEVMPPQDLTAVIVSHIHADHCSDIFALYAYLVHGLETPHPMRVIVPPDTRQPMGAFMRAGPDHGFWRICRFEEVDDESEVSVGSVQVRFRRAVHPVPTLAMRFEFEGRVLAYSADTGQGGGFPEIADEADVVLCEAALGPDRDPDDYPHHLSGQEAGAIARSAHAARLIVTHIPPTLDNEAVAAAAAEAFGGTVELATPGMQTPI